MANVRLRVGIVGLVALVLVSVLVSLPTVAAQPQAQNDDDAPPAWVQLSVVQVAPARVAEFMAVQRELMDRARDGETEWRTVSRTAVFGDNYRFLIATPGENLAGFNAGGNAAPELASLINRLERTITSRQSYAIRTLADLDNPLPEDEEPGVMVINLSKITPGREQEYYDVMATDVFPHFDEAEMHHITGSLALGGDGGYLHLFYLDNFANLDQGSPVVRALGPEGAQAVTEKLAGVVTSSEQWIASLVPELSYGSWSPEPEAAGGRGGRGGGGGGGGGAPPADEGPVTNLSGCFNKADTDGYYILAAKGSGDETRVTGIAALERHSSNHEVTVIGEMTQEDGKDVFTATEIQHIAATCSTTEPEDDAGEDGGSLSGCFNKAETEGYYILADKESGEETMVTGIAALERHSSNHEVTVIGEMTQEDGRDVFKATEIEHIAATCNP
jgi:hypothetical protein